MMNEQADTNSNSGDQKLQCHYGCLLIQSSRKERTRKTLKNWKQQFKKKKKGTLNKNQGNRNLQIIGFDMQAYKLYIITVDNAQRTCTSILSPEQL